MRITPSLYQNTFRLFTAGLRHPQAWSAWAPGLLHGPVQHLRHLWNARPEARVAHPLLRPMLQLQGLARTQPCSPRPTLTLPPTPDSLTIFAQADEVEQARRTLRSPPNGPERTVLALREKALLCLLGTPIGCDSLQQRIDYVTQLGWCGGHDAVRFLAPVVAASHMEAGVRAAAAAALERLQTAENMRIVMVAFEGRPYCGTGGLGNVMNELPAALNGLGHTAIRLHPLHACMDRRQVKPTAHSGEVVGKDGTVLPYTLYQARNDASVYFIESDLLFSKDRPGIYGDAQGRDYPDNAQRYDFFGSVTADVLTKITPGGRVPDVVQLNDAHTSSAAHYIRANTALAATTVVQAVHNLGGAYQGRFSGRTAEDTQFASQYKNCGPAEFYGDINFLKMGMLLADGTIMVSRTYKDECLVKTEEQGLDGVLNELNAAGRLAGNLNGIDNRVWDSATDPAITVRFKSSVGQAWVKKLNKRALLNSYFYAGAAPATAEETAARNREQSAPLFGMVARVTPQKGWDKSIRGMEYAIERADARGEPRPFFIACGQGSEADTREIRALAAKYPRHVAYDAGFNPEKERRLYAGFDFFLMPSEFEPCGLPQMYNMRYRTIPIVRATGGLDESIQEYNPVTRTGNGFKFGVNEAIEPCIERALTWFNQNRGSSGNALRDNCAASQFDWAHTSAPEQIALYRRFMRLKDNRRSAL